MKIEELIQALVEQGLDDEAIHQLFIEGCKHYEENAEQPENKEEDEFTEERFKEVYGA